MTFNGSIKKFHSFVEGKGTYILCCVTMTMYCVISDDADLFGSPVSPENQDFSVCPGHQNSSPAPHTAKVLYCVYYVIV